MCSDRSDLATAHALTSKRRPSKPRAAGLVAPGQFQDMRTEEVEDHLLADRRDLHQPSFAEVTRDVILLGIAHTAVGLQRPVSSCEPRIGAQVLCGIGFAPTGFAVVIEPG